jgi:hypothetical protein
MKSLLSAALCLALTGAALAQDAPPDHAPQRSTPLPKILAPIPTEEITITSSRLRSIVRTFVDVATMPSPLGAVSRWKTRLCPRATGMSPSFTAFVERRIRDIALQAGAPVDMDETCAPNLQIIFTERPQEMLDTIRTKLPALLGFHYVAQARELATARHPIQAWYATGTRDRMGQLIPDNPYGFATTTVEGSRIKTGFRAEFLAVTVVVDLVRVENQEIGAIADHAAMLALSQASAFERCRPVPSITNMFLDCGDDVATALTKYDAAYLKALYAIVDRDTPARLLKGDIAYLMRGYLAEQD